ncbi:MAG: GDSL-type esterase/lipase family protein [Planctomycetota bacterium]|nr:GDSL-type esterase/lipase family protein [Planctomycetota bacterium]
MSPKIERSRAWRRPAAVLAGLLLAPLVAEGAYRALRTAGLSPTTNPAYVEHDARLGWRYRPVMVERHASDEFDVEVRTNAQGFRGPDWDLGTAAGDARRPRVLVLGDSFAFGWGVEFAESLPARLQARRPDWNVLGAGVSGYGTDQECLLLEQLDATLRPDCVVVVFCENDLAECASDVAYGKHKPRFVREGGGLRLTGVPVPFPWIERTSLLWRALEKSRWERHQVARARDPNAEWALVCDLYRRMRTVLRDRPLVIVSDRSQLARLAADEPGIEHVDLGGAFGAGAARYHFAEDRHWNAAGHARAAEALAGALRPLLDR